MADDSHEMSRHVFSEKKNECRLLQILLGALRVKATGATLHVTKSTGPSPLFQVDLHRLLF